MLERLLPFVLKRGFAAKKGKFKCSNIFSAVKGVAAVAKTREIPVETDANKLVNFCCINYRIDEHPIPLKPDR